MRVSSRVSLLVALLFGMVAAFLVRGLVQGVTANTSTAHTIVVARGPIAFGTPLTAENLREVPWHGTDPLDGAFAKVSDLTGGGRRLALATLQRNEPILGARITGPNQRAVLSTQLEEGMRAVTVRVDEVRGVAGFVLPGDRVDIILTRGEGGGDAQAFADMLLQSAKVLAVDQLASEGQDKPTVARAVTLELSAQQAQKVVLAQGIGRLSLVLRQAGEAEGLPTTRVTASDLGTADPGKPDAMAAFEKRLAEMKEAEEKARAEAERQAAERLAELEERLRNAQGAAPQADEPARPSGSVVRVIRGGTKTEEYTVAAEPPSRR